MNLKALIGFVIYYAVIALLFSFGSPYLGGATTTAQAAPDLGTTNYSVNESSADLSNYDLSVWGSIKAIGRVALFMFFGIGLPGDTPLWFAVMFAMVMSGITILAVAVVLDAIHTG